MDRSQPICRQVSPLGLQTISRKPTSSRLVQRIAGAWLGLGLAGLTLLCSAEATAASALDTMQSFYDTLLTTMRRGNELGQSGRFIQLQPVVHNIFDVPFIARMAIGSGWGTVSSTQQQQMIEAFERYIVAMYADRFDTYSGEQIQVLGEQRSDAGTVVMTRIVDSNGEPQNLNYLLRSNGSVWQIADVFLNGTISELAIRRSEFAAIRQRQGVDGLIAELNRKADLLSAPPSPTLSHPDR
jgi:phospholipid transport system substrate-binding protein